MTRGTLDALMVPVAEALGEITTILGVDDGADLVARLGYRLPAGSDLPDLFDDVSTSASALAASLTAVVDAYADGSYNQPSFLKKVLDLIAAVIKAAKTADGLPLRAQAAIPDAAFLQHAGIDQLPLRLVDYLIVTYLRRKYPKLESLLAILGIVTQTAVAEGDYNPFYNKIEVRWDRIPKLFTDPKAILAEEYGWHRNPFHAEILLERINAFMWLSGVFGLALPIPDPVDADAPTGTQLDVPLFAGTISTPADGLAGVLAGLRVRRHDDPADVTNSGLAIEPYVDGSFDMAIDLREGWNLVIGADFAAQGLTLTVQPGGANIVLAGAVSAGVSVGVRRDGLVLGPLVLFGNAGGTRLDINTLSFAIGAELVPPNTLDAFVDAQLDGARIVVKPAPDEADSFLGSLLGTEGISAEMSFGIRLSRRSGLVFTGSGGLETSIPLHVTLGPIEFQGLTLGVKPRGQDVDVEVGATVSGKLGPLAFVVERVGLKLVAQFPNPADGKSGRFNIGMGFKPPNGLGLSIDAGTVKGGGYLYFDFDKEEYAGVLELSIANFLTLTAVGLVTTRMPDGSKGFSLLIIITAEFGTGIQLGFGFTLIGVGGLLGLNRTVKLQPLADGVRTGAVNNIMFPKNVVANAPRIISDLRAIFPAFEGKFLIGPMAKLGWGSPPLITLSLGVIIEIPGNLAILGVLKCVLPDAKAPVLVLQVAFVGAIEFDKKRLWLFAGIFDSKIMTFTLEGEMGVLFAWGDDADFVLSVGGFHPRFTPPPLPFPSPKRLALCILDEDQARIRVSSYFAVTTNTVQFGASAELFFGFSAISVDGHFQFDALFQFSPFYFVIELGASVSLKVFGMGVFSISLELALEGPTPWHARGRGSISFFFFDVSANFDETWGEEKDTTLPPIEVFPLLAEELAKEPNWSALPPKSGNLLVSLRVVGETKEFVLHPVGTLRITQRTVPLNSKIDLFGTQKPADANRFALAVKTPGLAIAKVVREEFAPAQFHAMSRNEKLAAPAFSQEDGGVDISATGDALRSSLVVRRIVRYEQIILDTNFKRFQKRFVTFSGSLFHHFLGGNAASRSSLSARLKNQMQPFQETIKTRSERFGVANTTNNTMVAGTGVFGSYHEAKEYMEQAIAKNPGLANTMHVLPDFEIRRVA
ncbi:DUF6603 domain-containing protein [Nitrospira defluvii]|uniref:DUF6603 domain-containing protein n=1 Tax=Nitrospira defluvii TaxID=330214 RepID=A0ABN7MAB3_9BACT|nr:DUF6603 domain-containing protein [Nitrospira defluvii]CAE6794411.1 conserved hypothetical protein [Nitrospira defluvii]